MALPGEVLVEERGAAEDDPGGRVVLLDHRRVQGGTDAWQRAIPWSAADCPYEAGLWPFWTELSAGDVFSQLGLHADRIWAVTRSSEELPEQRIIGAALLRATRERRRASRADLIIFDDREISRRDLGRLAQMAALGVLHSAFEGGQSEVWASLQHGERGVQTADMLGRIGYVGVHDVRPEFADPGKLVTMTAFAPQDGAADAGARERGTIAVAGRRYRTALDAISVTMRGLASGRL